jgi:hypothetical protein
MFNETLNFNVPYSIRVENPFIQPSAFDRFGQLEDCWFKSLDQPFNCRYFIEKMLEWEVLLNKRYAEGFPDGSTLPMYDCEGTTVKLRPQESEISQEQCALNPTYDRNINNILLEFKNLIVSVLPETEAKINENNRLFNFFKALESEVNKEKLRASPLTSQKQKDKYNQNVDTDYYLYHYAQMFLTIFQKAIDEYLHHTDNNKTSWEYKFARSGGAAEAKSMDPLSASARIHLWGEYSFANTTFYKDGWHGQTGRLRVIYYSLFVAHIEVYIKITRILRDKLKKEIKENIYMQSIIMVIKCLRRSFDQLPNKGFLGEKGQYSFIKILDKHTKKFAVSFTSILVQDGKHIAEMTPNNASSIIKDIKDIKDAWWNILVKRYPHIPLI